MQMTDTHMKKCLLVTKETQIVNTTGYHHTHTPEWLKFFKKTKNANCGQNLEELELRHFGKQFKGFL